MNFDPTLKLLWWCPILLLANAFGFIGGYFHECKFSTHREFLLRNGIGKDVSGKNIFYSTNRDKIGEEIICEIEHYPFEGWAELHH